MNQFSMHSVFFDWVVHRRQQMDDRTSLILSNVEKSYDFTAYTLEMCVYSHPFGAELMKKTRKKSAREKSSKQC